MVCGGYFSQRPTGFELVQHLGCLGLQPRRDFLLAPARLDLVLDLVERTFARRRDAGDVVPDVAVLKPQGVAFDADIGGKRPGEKPFRIGKLHWHACRIAAGAIDRLDGARLELQIGGGLGQQFALCARILDLVVEVENLGLGARGAQFLLEFAGHLLERANLLRLDLENLHEHGPETTLHRGADPPSLRAKAASAAARSITAALGTVPRSMSFSLLPSSLAISAKVAPFATRSAAALAASALGKSICRMWRRSGVT